MNKIHKKTLANVVITNRVLKTNPVSAASGERFISKLKIYKNYLQSAVDPRQIEYFGFNCNRKGFH